MAHENKPAEPVKIIQINEQLVQSQLTEVVRGTVEETLNALLEAEADSLCNAQHYERNEVRRDTRAGSYERGLDTKAGRVKLKVVNGKGISPHFGKFFSPSPPWPTSLSIPWGIQLTISKGAEAAAAAVRNSDHRALQKTGSFRGGNAGRDVPVWGAGTSGRGHHRGVVGNKSFFRDSE